MPIAMVEGAGTRGSPPPPWMQERLRQSHRGLGEVLLAIEAMEKMSADEADNLSVASSFRNLLDIEGKEMMKVDEADNLSVTSSFHKRGGGGFAGVVPELVLIGDGVLLEPALIGVPHASPCSSPLPESSGRSTSVRVTHRRGTRECIGRYTEMYVAEPARCMIELHNLPRFVDDELLQEICEVSAGAPAVAISSPRAKGSFASRVLTFASEEKKRQFVRLMDGVRFGKNVRHSVWTQELTGYECNALGFPRVPREAYVTDFIMTLLAFDCLMAVLGGMPCRNVIAPCSPRWKIFACYVPGCVSIIIQALSFAIFIWSAVIARENPHDEFGVVPSCSSAFVSVAMFGGMVLTFAGRHWVTTPFYDSLPLAVVKMALNDGDDDTMKRLLSRIWWTRGCDCMGFVFYVAANIYALQAGGILHHAGELFPHGDVVACVGFCLSSCSTLAMGLRCRCFVLCLTMSLHQLLEDTMTSNSFGIWNYEFIVHWNTFARLAYKARGETVILLLLYGIGLISSVSLMWLGADNVSRDTVELQPYYVTFLFLNYVPIAMQLLFASQLLWQFGGLTDMFSEVLYVVQRRYVFGGFSTMAEIEVMKFLDFCDSTWCRASHPLALVVGGVAITKPRIARLLNGYFSIMVSVCIRLAAKVL